MRRLLLVLAVIPFLGACDGLMPVPMVPRSTPEEFAAATEMWGNMLSPAERLPADTLLDTIMYYQFQQEGVDTVRYRSEKRFAGGTVVMEVYYDYATPLEDRFEVRVYDNDQKLVRMEVYSREDVERAVESSRALRTIVIVPEGDESKLSPEEREARQAARKRMNELMAERDRRLGEVILATRPAAEAEKLREEAEQPEGKPAAGK